MNIKFFLILMFFTSAIHVNAEELEVTEWNVQRFTSQMTDKRTCVLFSNKITFRNDFGSIDSAYIGVQDNNQITIHANKGSFDRRKINEFGIRAGKNPAVMSPEWISTTLVKFSVAKSKTLIEQLYNPAAANYFTLQVSFFPKGRIQNKKLHLGLGNTSFLLGYPSKVACGELNKLDDKSWAGVYLQDAGTTPALEAFIKDNSDYSGPGVFVWSVDPAKTASAAGLKTFDVILAANHKDINLSGLLTLLDNMKSGEKVTLTVISGNDIDDITLTKP